MSNINRDSSGKFAKSKKFIKRLVWFVIIVAILFGACKYYITSHPVTVYHNVEVDVTDKKFAEKIDSLEKSVVEQVRACESGGFKESDGLVTYDPKLGGKNDDKAMSYGTMQFKKATVIYYYKTLYQKQITGKEAILIALDDKLSGELAQAVMFKSNNLATDWLNCSTKLNLNVMIQAIKKIK